MKNGNFREDLYYRLNVVNIHLPPLRERGDDVLVIAKYLLAKYAEEFGSKVQRLHAQRADRDPQVRLARQHAPARKPHQEGDRAV